MNFPRENRADTSQFCKLRVILLLPKSQEDGGGAAGPHHEGLPAWPPSTSPSPPSSVSPSPPSSSSTTTGGLQYHDFSAAGLNSKGTYDCEFPPKLSVEQIKVPSTAFVLRASFSFFVLPLSRVALSLVRCRCM
jgi:hypothetical protein